MTRNLEVSAFSEYFLLLICLFTVTGEITVAQSLLTSTDSSYTLTVLACDIKDCSAALTVTVPIVGMYKLYPYRSDKILTGITQKLFTFS